MSTAGILLLVRDAELRHRLERGLEGWNGPVESAFSLPQALATIEESPPSVALVDAASPRFASHETLRELKKRVRDLKIILLERGEEIDAATLDQIHDVASAESSTGSLRLMLRRAVEMQELARENRRLNRMLRNERQAPARRPMHRSPRRETGALILIGESDEASRVRQFIADVGPSDLPVLIRGEEGTGRDLTARLIHEAYCAGRRAPFVKINCRAIPETQIESELFGHEPGAFPGADRRKPGRLELAAGGTIYLDGIEATPAGVQAGLLEVIDRRQFRRMGGRHGLAAETRVIVSTSRSLEAAVVEEKFDRELFHRLVRHSLELPRLADRAEDIPLLVRHFQQIYADPGNGPEPGITPSMMARLMNHDWPGNVGELERTIRRYIATRRESVIEELLSRPAPSRAEKPPMDRLQENEIRTIMAALRETRWNQRRAAEILGIGYSALRRRIAKYDLKSRWREENYSSMVSER